MVFFVFYNVFSVEFGAERIDIEEWVLPVVDLGRWLSVFALEALVAYGWQIHVGSLLSDLDSLEPAE